MDALLPTSERAGLREVPRFLTPAASVGPWQAVHRSLVHKRHSDQVVIAAYRDETGDALVFDVRDARRRMSSQLDDAGFVAESLRQSTIALAHLQHGVANDWAFLMDRMSFRIGGRSLNNLPTTVRITARDVLTRAGNLQSLTSVFELLFDEHVLATGEGYLRVMRHGIYRRIRAGRAMRQPARAAKRVARPVVLHRADDCPSGGEANWTASIDPEDPFFFDHEVDHLPGMALYEAACAVASVTSQVDAPRVVAFDGSFYAFVELGEELQLSAKTLTDAGLGVPASIAVEVSSQGCVVMSATADVLAAQATRIAD